MESTVIEESPGLWRVTNTGYPSNTYVCQFGSGSDCFVVDPGLDGAAIDALVETLGLTPRLVFCTHGHFDHVGSASLFQQKYGAPVHLHSADVPTMKGSNFLLMAFKLPYRVTAPEVVRISDGFRTVIGNGELVYRLTRGHTPGSCLIIHDGVVFTGDTLYAQGIGLSKLPGEDLTALKESLQSIWGELPEEAMIYPGHGEPARFSWIKQNNRALLRFMGLPQYQGSSR